MTEYGKLLRQSSIAIAIFLVAVLICYFWIDRPVAFFVHRHHFDEIKLFRWLTYPPPEVQTWSPLILTLLLFDAPGTIASLAKSPARRLPQPDRGRSIPCLSRRCFWPLLAGNVVA